MAQHCVSNRCWVVTKACGVDGVGGESVDADGQAGPHEGSSHASHDGEEEEEDEKGRPETQTAWGPLHACSACMVKPS